MPYFTKKDVISLLGDIPESTFRLWVKKYVKKNIGQGKTIKYSSQDVNKLLMVKSIKDRLSLTKETLKILEKINGGKRWKKR